MQKEKESSFPWFFLQSHTVGIQEAKSGSSDCQFLRASEQWRTAANVRFRQPVRNLILKYFL